MTKLIEEMVYCKCGEYVLESTMIPVNNDESICQDCADAYESWADAQYDRMKGEQDERNS